MAFYVHSLLANKFCYIVPLCHFQGFFLVLLFSMCLSRSCWRWRNILCERYIFACSDFLLARDSKNSWNHITVYKLLVLDKGGCPHNVVANMLDCDIVVSEFKLQSCYYIHFQTNTLGKGMNPLIPLCWTATS